MPLNILQKVVNLNTPESRFFVSSETNVQSVKTASF